MNERVVPPEGAIIDGYAIPGGTVVGINPWVIHRNHEVFGDDLDAFRPERWLEATPEVASNKRKNLFSVRPPPPRTCRSS